MKYPPTRILAAGLFFAVFLAGCASSPQGALDKGECPAYIVFPGERSQLGRERYGEGTSESQLAGYRDREIANCERHLAGGDAKALAVLLEYWYSRKNLEQVAAANKTYLENGSDERELAEASESLYELYSGEQPGLAKDPDAAFHYLGLASHYDPASYERQYADALYHRGLYADAFSLFSDIIGREPSEDFLTRSERCEINLKMADLYFRGRGVRENWNVGYYYWLEGLSTANDPTWGSCDKQTYYDHDRYRYESRRKKDVDRRVTAMGTTQSGRVKAARADPEKDLPYIAALDFRRPLYREPTVASTPRRPVQPTPVSVTRPVQGKAWPPWSPLKAELCGWNTSFQPRSWSEVFQLRSGAIWSIKSNSGGAKSMGSAVAVSPTTLVTNCHIIQDYGELTLLKVGSSLPAKVIAADREGDRCILRAGGSLPSYVSSARQARDILVGEDVAAIGNPKGLDTSLSRGLVAQKRNKNGDTLIQTDAAISSGSSGGGLFDTSGNLVGITTFKVSTGESLNFAIAIDEFCH